MYELTCHSKYVVKIGIMRRYFDTQELAIQYCDRVKNVTGEELTIEELK